MAEPAEVSSWERSMLAGERVWERAKRVATALDSAAVPYAIVGGNAVAEWVGRVDDGAVRYTPDVDILIRRADFEAAKKTLEAIGFVYSPARGIDTFLEGLNPRPREPIDIIYAREKVRPDYISATPDVSESERTTKFNVISLNALVEMKLNSNRDKDRTHVRDLIQVGLVDPTWIAKLPSELAERLQHLLDTPDG